MSLQSAIDNLKDRVIDAYDALEAKGATMPSTKNTANLPTSIGSIVELKGETKSASPSTSQQIITPTSGKNGITQMTILPVTSSIDANIVAGNIKNGVSILGVTGNYQGSGGGGATGYTLTVSNESGSSTIEAIPTSGDRVVNVSPGNSASDIVAIHMNLAVCGIGWIKVNDQVVWNESPMGDYWFDQWIVLTADSVAYREYNDSCMLEGTKIMLSDGKTEKNIEDITFDDELLVWDFDNGCLSKSKPAWIAKKNTNSYYFINTYLSGKTLKTTGESSSGWGHRVLDLKKNKFIYTTESIGDSVYTLDGIDLTTSCTRVEENCNFYNVITERHFNLFANRILTSCSLNNMYKIENMKFMKDRRKLRNITDYSGIPEYLFKVLRLSENDTDIQAINAYITKLIKTCKERNHV